MTEDRETAFAKVNLALHVREKRPDDYHRIETLFAFCEHGDELTALGSEHLLVEVQGPMAGGISRGDELASRAAHLLMEKRRQDNPGFLDGGATISLTKILPVAGGLGGGSADAAAALRLLNRHWRLGLPDSELEALGRKLGADVPVCIRSVTMQGEGRGDEIEPVDLGLSGTPVLLVNPRVQLSTAAVFSRWDGVDRGPLTGWEHGRNDLEPAATAIVPQIGAILAWLSVQPGVTFVRMSGSGATCFAMFESDEQRDRSATAVPREWWHLATRLR